MRGYRIQRVDKHRHFASANSALKIMTKSSMSIARTLLCGVLFTLAMAARAQPAATKSVSMPTFKAGSTWIYRIHTQYSGQENSEDVQWTLLYRDKKGGWLFSREKPAPAGTEEVIYRISGITDETWSGRDSTEMKEPARDLLSFPLTVGKTWESHYEQGGTLVTCNHKAVNWERVKVPSGSFFALKIEYECNNGDETVLRVVQWYAPAVQNFVREVMDFVAQGNDQNIFELLSYKIGK